MMHLNADISSALQLLEDIKHTVDELDDSRLLANTTTDLNLLISVLENPIFRSIVTVQDSLSELNQQLGQHPSILPVDFDITPAGELALNVPPGGDLYDAGYGDDYQHPRDFDEQRVPSAPVSPGSPQLHSFTVNEDKLMMLDRKPLLEQVLSHDKVQGLVPRVEEDSIHRSPSAVSDASKAGSDTLSNTEWAQVEAIELVNDGTGLGFGIVGVRTMGVVVKTIILGGVADRDGRLKSGDHILQIGDVNLHEMGSEQVATVLRQSGTHVRLVVARPADLTSEYLSSTAPLVPTRLLTEPAELDCYLIQNNCEAIFQKQHEYKEYLFDLPAKSYKGLSRIPASPSLPLLNLDMAMKMPEMEKFTVELKKDANGLGITIAGYVAGCEKEKLSGIFVKSISKGSAADLSGKIQVNDRIVEVDGVSLEGYTNHDAVEVLKSSGGVVKIAIERYLHGPKFEQLQQAIAADETKPTPSSPPKPRFPKERKDLEFARENSITKEPIEAKNEHLNLLHDKQYQCELTPAIEEAIMLKWSEIFKSKTEIVVAQLTKFAERGGLGISLEGTVDLENGQEVRPHHYIRSILPEGPVGKNGKLRSGDELLEVNEHMLLGMNHHEVVSILKELPLHVRMVCGRTPNSISLKQPDQIQNNINERNGLGGSLQNLVSASDRLVKAKSDGSIATAAATTEISFNKIKSRSLEPLTGLAMWSSLPQIIELVKGERGLGFSILDYQDPIDPNNTVIVIRSLVPGGVAQLDGRLIPGDRLLFVNDTALENASLDQAVQALKGAAKGVVRIGVAKPLPITDTVAFNTQQNADIELDTKSLVLNYD
ncbi:PREDICTED: patj homolog [Nicrophorus vespilloides]|uniref:Patj homolog n=1 Tax=Nicrophorus vespilloides TaxID=110193 RepID=A0ABM1NA28_NICVS|nr:PREDICTED: patj homolog [Nicrophorus vespilloides]